MADERTRYDRAMRLRWALPATILIALLADACGRSGVGGPGDDDDDAGSGTPTPAATPTLLAGPDDLALNEVYFLISGCTTVECDANRSGSVGDDDEFVEIVNVALGPRSLAGIGIHESNGDPAAPRYVFGSNAVLAPMGAVVVFGGFGGAVPDPSRFGGALLFEVAGLADLDLSNQDDYVELRRSGTVLRRLAWTDTAALNFSITLTPDIDLETGVYATHPQMMVSGTAHNTSPGWRANFTLF